MIDVAVHAQLKIEDESIYEVFLDDLQKVFESYAFITPEVEVKACDQDECFDKNCEMRAAWRIR